MAFVGDTPAVSMVGGFKEGVGLAMRKCRQCMATYDQIQSMVSNSLYNYIYNNCSYYFKKSLWRVNFT